MTCRYVDSYRVLGNDGLSVRVTAWADKGERVRWKGRRRFV